MRPGAPPKSCGYVYTGPGEVSSLVTDPPGTPVTPRIYINKQITEVLHLCRCVTWCHGRWSEDEDEGGVKVRWPWRWDEEILNQDAKRGTQKKKERTPTQHTWPGAGKPWKGKGKEKRRVDGHGTRPAEVGGKDESAWTNLTRREPTHISARDGTDLPREGRTHEIGDQWGLVGETTKKKNKTQFLNT